MELGNTGIGTRGELFVAEWFLKRGYPVYRPLVDVGADLVVDLDGEFIRVQVRSYSGDEDSHVFKVGRKPYGQTGWVPHEDGAVDWYALCWLNRGYIGLIPPNGVTSVRVTPGSEKYDEIAIETVMSRLTKEE